MAAESTKSAGPVLKEYYEAKSKKKKKTKAQKALDCSGASK
jgi:hypothetical protein